MVHVIPIRTSALAALGFPRHAAIRQCSINVRRGQAQPRIAAGRQEQLGIDPLVERLDLRRDSCVGQPAVNLAGAADIRSSRCPGRSTIRAIRTSRTSGSSTIRLVIASRPATARRRVLAADQVAAGLVELGLLGVQGGDSLPDGVVLELSCGSAASGKRRRDQRRFDAHPSARRSSAATFAAAARRSSCCWHCGSLERRRRIARLRRRGPDRACESLAQHSATCCA